jgi:hexosaminidase
MRNILFVAAMVISFLCSGCYSEQEISVDQIVLIPKPQHFALGEGTFLLNKNTSLFCEAELKIAEDFLREYLQLGVGIPLTAASKEKADVQILLDPLLPKEGYSLRISETHIVLKAADAGGAFYGVQTLRQLLPVQLERQNTKIEKAFAVPQLEIFDAPKFAYRGMHLDVGRHFFSKEFIKKYIANMALLKMNYFHWHLTEDQGWRIEIKKYPKLMSHAAYREETLIGHYNETPQQYDGQRYGGYYTQEDVAEIVAFAATLNVTIIPEIEMPGHAQAALSAYPELGCTGEQIPVATKWGVFEHIYCPNEKTFTFLKDVLEEVIPLFPGEYIHIGGDEAPKTQWEKCDHCQKLIQDLNLIDEHGLQSYFIKEMEAFINTKGKKIIGWDEILEGGLAPNATVMSWRGMQGGIDAAKQKHPVIMTPTSHSYFDYYQADHPDEPLAIGGFLPLKKVYSFNPIPRELSTEEASYIWGAQGNLWTEYIKTEAQVEYMAFPRMLAMSEVVWSGASENLEDDYPEFLSRVERFLERLDALQINYANHLYELEGTVLKENGDVFYELTTPTEGKAIQYSVNNSAFKKYSAPIPITANSSLKANVFKNGEKVGRDFSEHIVFHKGVKGRISINVPPHPAYGAGGTEALINGISGSDTRYGDKEWLGFWGDDLQIEINLDEATQVKGISTRLFHAPGQWIYAPDHIAIRVILVDDSVVATKYSLTTDQLSSIIDIDVPFTEWNPIIAKKIILMIPSYGTISEGAQGAGNKAWTFIDEIKIE